MPLDVLLGYIYADSLSRTAQMGTVATMGRTLTDNDTLRYGMRYLYQMQDYDPVLFTQWTGVVDSTYSTDPGWAENKLVKAAIRNMATPNDAMMKMALLYTSYILHIRATNESLYLDTNATRVKNHVLVTAELIDPIKGKVLPYCVNADGTDPTGEYNLTKPAAYGECVQFDYCLEWTRLNHSDIVHSTDSTFGSTEGNRWIKMGEEYIVFLTFASPRMSDSNANYRYLTPGNIVGITTTGGMYPVIGGTVQNPEGDLGLGTNMSVGDFKSAIRAKIADITSYTK
jgi:hypothetical protein